MPSEIMETRHDAIIRDGIFFFLHIRIIARLFPELKRLYNEGGWEDGTLMAYIHGPEKLFAMTDSGGGGGGGKRDMCPLPATGFDPIMRIDSCVFKWLPSPNKRANNY